MNILASGGGVETALHHITDGHELDFFGLVVHIPEALQAIGVTKLVIYLWVCGAFTIFFCLWAARGRKQRVPTGLYNFFETILLFVRDDIVVGTIGEKDANKWMPFIWTVFFFIFFNNACGLLPMGATSTGNLSVTLALAGMIFVMIHAIAMTHGVQGYFHAIVPSVPWWLWPLMLVLEMIGFVAKAIALAMRLFANMVAGHMVLLTILCFTLMFGQWIAVIAVPGAVAIYFLEIFVSALQAYIFCFLSSVFIGGVLHPDH